MSGTRCFHALLTPNFTIKRDPRQTNRHDKSRLAKMSSLRTSITFKLWTPSFVLLVATMSVVRCRPLDDEVLSDSEPLSVADGYIHYSVANDSRLREISRKAFESLISEPVGHKQDYSSQEIVFHPHSQDNEKPDLNPKKHAKPGRRKPLLDGRNKALILIKDTREMQKCEGAKFKQRVKSPGCLTKVVVNRCWEVFDGNISAYSPKEFHLHKSIKNGQSLLANWDSWTLENALFSNTNRMDGKAQFCFMQFTFDTQSTKFCHGTCPSYFIPRMNSKALKAKFKSCAACAPRDYDAVDVTLDCPGQDPPQITKTIIKIKKCECIDLDLSSHFRL